MRSENCTAAWARSGFTVTNHMICAGGYRDACEGDSGGPLTCKFEGRRYICGIVSWGQSCNDRHNPYYPGLYTDIRSFHYWVKRQIRTLASTLPEIVLPALVLQETIRAELHGSLNFSCQPHNGAAVSLCLWQRDESVVIDHQPENGTWEIVPGISYLDQGRWSNKCGLQINSLSEADFKSRWTCVLVADDATISAGSVSIEHKPAIYFTTRRGGIQAHSTLTSRVTTILSTSENCYGITYGADQNKIYWSTEHKIYRANAADGTEVEIVLSNTMYGKFQGMAFDWISANIYISTSDGYMFACRKNAARTLTCVPIIYKNGSWTDIKQIALNPVQGTMYWTAYTGFGSSSIRRAGMDGSNASTIVTGLKSPRGIVLDLQMSRLYWADYRANRIQSSTFDGRDVRTVIEFPAATPIGIAVVDDTIFWTSSANRELQSSTKTGADIRILHRDTNPMRYLAVVPDLDLRKNRTNHCEGKNCPTICVLNPTSFTCF